VGLILDTSVLIAAERQRFDLEALLDALADETVAIAAVTAAELLHGVERARTPGIRANRSHFVEGVLDTFPVVPFGLPQVRVYAGIWAGLAAKGRMVGAHDLQVAATALTLGNSVATLNQKDFKRVAGLSLVPLARFMKS
jgi:tRNA(fMet)-specific endonuclease VapC